VGYITVLVAMGLTIMFHSGVFDRILRIQTPEHSDRPDGQLPLWNRDQEGDGGV
jgi:hypothetical protein